MTTPARRCRIRPPSVEFTAFCQLYRRAYLDYARARTGSDSCAQHAVEATIERLAHQWHVALRSACLQASAWAVLRAATADHDACRPPENPFAYEGLLAPSQADAVLLHQCLGWDIEKAAELMGAHPSSLRGWLTTAALALGLRAPE
ncbi:hypothetical protein [Streptomyces zagrosensis]|uniref:DNA-directed RNA polymerase specialized sigma24 family protein n=1 Tax=Streptomyces zagrosensis TaxID=1042984 RepID=A0A7W9V116_9ACTN|nr:hypothetical protein [Streptomyces zagrosensis]MBB5938730.1 DNA-directed RNA polymerase specialized sigma24 family protein [Streptomyces zagrosensis]